MRATPSFWARGCLIISSELGRKNFFCAGLPNYLFKLAARGIFLSSCTVEEAPARLHCEEPPPSCAQNVHYFLFCSILRLIFLRSSCGGDIKGGDRKFCNFPAPVLGYLKCWRIKNKISRIILLSSFITGL